MQRQVRTFALQPCSETPIAGAFLAAAVPMNQAELKERTMVFALEVSALCQHLQTEWPQRRLADQLFRSSTSVAANYHAATRARSKREFLSKLGLVAEEAE